MEKNYAVTYTFTGKDGEKKCFQDVIRSGSYDEAGSTMQGRHTDKVGEGPMQVLVAEFEYLQPGPITLDWEDYPMWTRARALGGGYWTKTAAGWKWCTGDTFPQPGTDAVSVQFPVEVTS